eukprot:TRINITY_DN8615_c0_g1_i1.p1 TRINITY_DN8615_c0_g1~~TRINITY_DN8615_c0_g1_i1.p1  ORF type:complete len:409 (-),score=92.44 TRINITY_DN8615_c0_g1_i1:30-1106(-)
MIAEAASTPGEVDVLVHARDEKQRTPLHYASQYGSAAVVSLLLKHGAKTEARDNNRLTPLHLAAQSGSPETVRLLVGAGAQLDSRDDRLRAPLHLAAGKGASEVVSDLCQAGATVDVTDEQSRTPLHFAALLGDVEVVRLLLEYGADKSRTDSDKRTPMHCALAAGRAACVAELSRETVQKLKEKLFLRARMQQRRAEKATPASPPAPAPVAAPVPARLFSLSTTKTLVRIHVNEEVTYKVYPVEITTTFADLLPKISKKEGMDPQSSKVFLQIKKRDIQSQHRLNLDERPWEIMASWPSEIVTAGGSDSIFFVVKQTEEPETENTAQTALTRDQQPDFDLDALLAVLQPGFAESLVG